MNEDFNHVTFVPRSFRNVALPKKDHLYEKDHHKKKKKNKLLEKTLNHDEEEGHIDIYM